MTDRGVSLDAGSAARLRASFHARWPATIWRIEGPAAVACVQGIVSTDVASPGNDTLTYGALLTPKGAILTDAWFLRHADGFRLVAPGTARQVLAAEFRRTLPPRLARVTDESATMVAAVLGGAAGPALAASAGQPTAAGAVLASDDGTWVARAPTLAPFAALAVGPAGAVAQREATWSAAGAMEGDEALREAWRIVCGWPALGAEIGERTLPQEVRFDEHGGVSYQKGCYTGQETVARLHFRGHANRTLRGLRLSGAGEPSGDQVLAGERLAGRLTSRLDLPGVRLGLSLVRREVTTGSSVLVGGIEARVVDLPFTEAGAG